MHRSTAYWLVVIVVFCAEQVAGFAPNPRSRSPSHLLMAEKIPSPGNRPPPQGGDMAYIRENIARQMETYQKIRKGGGIDCINDVYARDPKRPQFWFIGKVARCTGTVTLNQAIARQLNLIEEHATRIRPVELGRCFKKLQIWTAPADSELEMSNNNPSIRLDLMQRYVEGCEDVDPIEVGFGAELVTNEGMGFYIERNNDGMVPPHLMQ
eukprot:scaffold74861_cov52-Attheya_sp.AAC.2